MEEYRMTRDELQQRLQEIGTCTDDAERRTLIASLSEDASADYDAHAAVVTERDQLQTANQQLQNYNMDLFKRLPVKKDDTPAGGDKPAEKRKFEDLFNEKGEIK